MGGAGYTVTEALPTDRRIAKVLTRTFVRRRAVPTRRTPDVSGAEMVREASGGIVTDSEARGAPSIRVVRGEPLISMRDNSTSAGREAGFDKTISVRYPPP